MMMPVEMKQWRVTIGCFHVSINGLGFPCKTFRPFLIISCVSCLYWFCCCFIAISVFVLPFVLILQFFAMHFAASQLGFLPLFAHAHQSVKTVLYTIKELVKRIPLVIRVAVRKKYFHSHYGYVHMACVVCYALHIGWLFLRTILLSGDVEINPGPESFDFCCWNLNSITTYDFLRVSLIEAYNSVCNYDLIGIVETQIDSTVDEDRLSLDGYTFLKDNHPQNVKRGGVGLYVRDSLPSKNRSDLVTLPECIVCEIHLNRKKYFFVVVYRSPSQNHSEFENFMMNFELLLSKMHAENPFSVIITGDFNCRSSQWWENDIENNEGKLFEIMTSDLGLHQLISEPTHLMGESKSCIDLIFSDQPNLIIESGVHPSLHELQSLPKVLGTPFDRSILCDNYEIPVKHNGLRPPYPPEQC